MCLYQVMKSKKIIFKKTVRNPSACWTIEMTAESTEKMNNCQTQAYLLINLELA